MHHHLKQLIVEIKPSTTWPPFLSILLLKKACESVSTSKHFIACVIYKIFSVECFCKQIFYQLYWYSYWQNFLLAQSRRQKLVVFVHQLVKAKFQLRFCCSWNRTIIFGYKLILHLQWFPVSAKETYWLTVILLKRPWLAFSRPAIPDLYNALSEPTYRQMQIRKTRKERETMICKRVKEISEEMNFWSIFTLGNW